MENYSPEIESTPKAKGPNSILLLCATVLLVLSLACSVILYLETQSLEAQCASLRETLSAQQSSYLADVEQLTQELDDLRAANDSAMEYIVKLNKRTGADSNFQNRLTRICRNLYHKQYFHGGKAEECKKCDQLFDKNASWIMFDFYLNYQ